MARRRRRVCFGCEDCAAAEIVVGVVLIRVLCWRGYIPGQFGAFIVGGEQVGARTLTAACLFVPGGQWEQQASAKAPGVV